MRPLSLRNKTKSEHSYIAVTPFSYRQDNKRIATESQETKLSHPSFYQTSRYHKQSDSFRTEHSQTVRNKPTNLTYNKWYIKPSLRMKPSQSSNAIDKSDTSFLYNQLYKQRYVDPLNPFNNKPNQKMKLLNLLPKSNYNCLEQFKRNQLKRKKRVPEIVNMLTRQMRIKTQM